MNSEILQKIPEKTQALFNEVGSVVIGQTEIVEDLLACLLAGGHCLLVGVPGLAKTLLVHTLAQTLDLQFNRIQFTPDLMPADITGSEILQVDETSGQRQFQFVKGPVFHNILLADEINRTPPKTQSALLQAMQERTVTSTGKTYRLPEPFWVLATQNPIEQEGTYPLPEAQLDRFMFSLNLGYPDAETEEKIATIDISQDPALRARPVLNRQSLTDFQQCINAMPVEGQVVSYAVALVRASRPGAAECPANVSEQLSWGAGPRASQNLLRAARAYAALQGRPTPDFADVKRAFLPVMRHRVIRSFSAEVDNVSTDAILTNLLTLIKRPVP